MVSLLIIGLVLPYDKEMIDKLKSVNVHVAPSESDVLFWAVIVISVVGLAWAIWQSKRETPEAG